MTVLPVLEFSGEDELLVLSVSDDVREATVKLPPHDTATSKLVTVEKLVSNKWSEPGSPKERLVSTTHQYIAYVISGKANSTMVKIMDKDDFGKRTIMKDIAGRVVEFMFKSCEEEEDVMDETFALISLEDSGKLHLSVYEIIVTDTQALQNSEVCKLVLCEDVPLSVTPVLAIQPHDPDTTVVAVAVDTQIYYVKIKEDTPPEVKDFKIDGVDCPIVSIYIASDENTTIAVCTKDGTIAFYNPGLCELHDDPWRVYENDNNVVHWMGFPDDTKDQSKQVWNTVIVASDTSISVFSLQHWKLSYSLNILYPPNQNISQYMRYNLDPRGRFLVLSSYCSYYLYILELAKTPGSQAPDAFTKIFCYPVKHGIFDLSISTIVREESVQGRYEDTSERHMISMIGISSSAMYKWRAVFDTSYVNTGYRVKGSRSCPGSEPGDATQDPPSLQTLPSPSSFATNPTFSNSASLPSPQSFTTHDASRDVTTASRDVTTAARDASRDVTTAARDASRDVSTADSAAHPKLAPACSAYQEIRAAGDDLMPTPLPTPVHARRLSEDEEMLDILSQIFIQGADTDNAIVFELYLAEKLNSASGSSDHEFCADFIEFYNEERVKYPDLHPTVFNQIVAKQLIRAAFNSPVVIREISQAYPALGEDFTTVLMELVKVILSLSSWQLSLKHFSSIREIVRELYSHSVPCPSSAQYLMLRLLEALIKSYYEREERDGEEVLQQWGHFLAENLRELTELIRLKDSKNQGFLIQVKDVLEPLKYSMPVAFDTLLQGLVKQSEGISKLLQIMKNSEVSEDSGTGRYETVVCLLQYLDQESTPGQETVSCDKALDIARRIILNCESGASSEIANEVVNNYYNNGWYTELILLLCNEIPEIEPVFVDSLTNKIATWFKQHSGVPVSQLLSASVLECNTREGGASVVDLIKTVLLIQEHSRTSNTWEQLKPEIREIVLLQVKRVLIIETDEMAHVKSGPDPVTKPPRHVTSPTTRHVTSPTCSPDDPLVPHTSAITTNNTSPPDTSPPATSPPAPSPPAREPPEHSSPADSHVFASSDIREKNKKVQYMDASATASMKKINTGLSRALNDIHNLSTNQFDKQEIKSAIQNCCAAVSRGEPDADVTTTRECASLFFDRAFSHLSDSMDQFYESELINKLRLLLEDMLENQNKLNFELSNKSEKEIRKDVTQMVKVVNEEVQRCLVNGLSAEETLKKQISSTLLPSFQRILEQIYTQFEGVLQSELAQYTYSLTKGRQTEDEILSQLDRMDQMIEGHEERQQRAHANVMYYCSNVEKELSGAVADLLARHSIT